MSADGELAMSSAWIGSAPEASGIERYLMPGVRVSERIIELSSFTSFSLSLALARGTTNSTAGKA